MAERGKSGRKVDQRTLAKRLREAREFLNLSQQFVADQTGIPRSAVSEIERGNRKVDSLELRRLADLYRFPVSYFLGEQADPAGTKDPTALRALNRTARGLTERDRDEVLKFALFLRHFGRHPAEKGSAE